MAFQGDSIFWVEVGKVAPNPFQPRREFDESKLQELSESIRMYGVLQPLTVTRQEVQNGDGTFYTQYELIAGERRLRASKLAGVAQVPVIIREGEESEQEKLELAIIENLQREDLNAIDRALAFQQLAEQFNLSHNQVGKKVGRSREYVANSIRLLQLPAHMQETVQRGELSEGHARTLLMLSDKPEEQETLFREVLLKKMSVRELERISRKIATDKVRKQNPHDIGDHLIEIEKEFTETLGTRVQIMKTEFGGKLTIDYFSDEDLAALLERVKAEQGGGGVLPGAAVAMAPAAPGPSAPTSDPIAPATASHAPTVPTPPAPPQPTVPPVQPVAPAALAHTTPVTPPDPSSEPTPATVPATPAQPAVDQSLLERLAAHTPLSFTTSAPAAEQVPAPSVNRAPTTPPTIPNLVSSTPLADLPAPPEPPVAESAPTNPDPATTSAAQDPADDQDLYAMRNFTV